MPTEDEITPMTGQNVVKALPTSNVQGSGAANQAWLQTQKGPYCAPAGINCTNSSIVNATISSDSSVHNISVTATIAGGMLNLTDLWNTSLDFDAANGARICLTLQAPCGPQLSQLCTNGTSNTSCGSFVTLLAYEYNTSCTTAGGCVAWQPLCGVADVSFTSSGGSGSAAPAPAPSTPSVPSASPPPVAAPPSPPPLPPPPMSAPSIPPMPVLSSPAPPAPGSVESFLAPLPTMQDANMSIIGGNLSIDGVSVSGTGPSNLLPAFAQKQRIAQFQGSLDFIKFGLRVPVSGNYSIQRTVNWTFNEQLKAYTTDISMLGEFWMSRKTIGILTADQAGVNDALTPRVSGIMSLISPTYPGPGFTGKYAWIGTMSISPDPFAYWNIAALTPTSSSGRRRRLHKRRRLAASSTGKVQVQGPVAVNELQSSSDPTANDGIYIFGGAAPPMSLASSASGMSGGLLIALIAGPIGLLCCAAMVVGGLLLRRRRKRALRVHPKADYSTIANHPASGASRRASAKSLLQRRVEDEEANSENVESEDGESESEPESKATWQPNKQAVGPGRQPIRTVQGRTLNGRATSKRSDGQQATRSAGSWAYQLAHGAAGNEQGAYDLPGSVQGNVTQPTKANAVGSRHSSSNPARHHASAESHASRRLSAENVNRGSNNSSFSRVSKDGSAGHLNQAYGHHVNRANIGRRTREQLQGFEVPSYGVTPASQFVISECQQTARQPKVYQ